LLDLMSFRDLYGYLTREKEAELKKLQEGANLKEVSRENAEEALFGGGDEVVADATPGVIDVDAQLSGLAERLKREEQLARVYSQEDLEHGVVLNAAVLLKEPELLEQTMKDIEAAAERDGLELKVVSWQQASGLIGQFILLARIILYIAVLIIFIVALVIINNAMVMATLERVREFGTMRAIGAQRRFVLSMLLVEALVVGLLFGALGGLVGGGLVRALGAVGIPATTDVLYFFFSGPRLYPFLATSNLVAAFVIVLVVSTLSAFYPAFLAMRVSPRQAMQSED
ncbi:MAG: ABC transporter permease, partial [Myxococcales bacterium]